MTHSPVDKLTITQMRTLEAIRRLIADRGIAPSVRDIADALGVNINAAQCMIEQLERKGFIVRDPRLARSIRVVEDEVKDRLLAKIATLDVQSLRKITEEFSL